MIRLVRLDERAGRGIELAEMVSGLGRRRVPGIAQTEGDGEVGPPLEAILQEGVIRRLQNLVVSRAKLDGKSRR